MMRSAWFATLILNQNAAPSNQETETTVTTPGGTVPKFFKNFQKDFMFTKSDLKVKNPSCKSTRL